MPSLLAKVLRRRKRRLKDGLRDNRTFKLYRAACRLLAERDYEQIPVAHFAQAADMSVGAFYERFSDKDAFLGTIISLRLSGVRRHMEDKLDPKQWQHRSATAVTRAIVEEMMRNLQGHGSGVVRAALKRGHLDRRQLEPLQRYRAALADQAVTLLSKRVNLKKPDRAIRCAVQMAEATALDALLHEKGPLRPGSRHMAAALSAMMHRVLNLAEEPAEGAQIEDDERAPADDGDANDLLDMPPEEVVAMPIPDPPPARKPRLSRRTLHTEPAESIPTVDPAPTRPPRQEAEKPEPPRRGRYRPRL